MNKLIKCSLFKIAMTVFATTIFISSCSYKTIIGKTYINYDIIPCSLVACDCCNECGSNIYFITGSDTVLLEGKPNGQTIQCKGNECDVRDSTMHCKPFAIGKKYKLKGKRIKKGNRNKSDIFKVNSFTVLDGKN